MHEQLYAQQRQHALQHPLLAWPGLGAWSFYFLMKVALAATGHLELNLFWSLALLALLVIPLRFRALMVLRQLAAIPAAAALMYSETHLPPLERLTAQWDLVSSFSGWYMLELAGRMISLEAVAALLVAWILYLYLSRVLRMTVVTLVALLSYPLWSDHVSEAYVLPEFTAEETTTEQGTQTATTRRLDPDSVLEQFYARQSEVQLAPLAGSQPDFDILMLNVCSLSWQDLEEYDLLDHPFWERADVMLNQFYTGSSYSGPATLRLLQSSCGHRPHNQLFEPEQSCQLGHQLQQIGYGSEIRMNHSGAFDNFLQQVQNLGGLNDAPFIDPSQFPVAMDGFDQSPIYSDEAILQDWLSQAPDEPQFTFYNTTSLHDGNRVPGFRGSSVASFRHRANNLLDDLNNLFDEIAASGRQVLVVMVPEHGAGLQGDAFQLPGMREIPTPALTHVPVMLTLFGADLNEQRPSSTTVSRRTGPTAVSQAIYSIIEQRPFSGGQYDPAAVARDLPETRPVLENDRTVMMEVEGQFLLQINRGSWRPYRRR